jgi:hypothetical protein
MDMEQRIKMAVIAGASRALKLIEKRPRLSDTEILQQVTKESNDIARDVGTED